MFFLIPVTTFDPSLGRIDKSALSQQSLMELFIKEIENRELICSDPDIPNDLKFWSGVIFDHSENIRMIRWGQHKLTGKLHFEWLPSTVIGFNAHDNQFEGSLPLGDLPPELFCLILSGNRLSGNLDLENLPDTLDELRLDSNRLTGTVSLTKLPPNMKVLTLGDNRLFGSVDLTQLPPTMERLYLCKNDFEGETDFSKLPDEMWDLNVSDNPNLEGEVWVDELQYETISENNTKVTLHLKS